MWNDGGVPGLKRSRPTSLLILPEIFQNMKNSDQLTNIQSQEQAGKTFGSALEIAKKYLKTCYTEGTIQLNLSGCVCALCIVLCCGAGTGPVGTVPFCPSGTG